MSAGRFRKTAIVLRMTVDSNTVHWPFITAVTRRPGFAVVVARRDLAANHRGPSLRAAAANFIFVKVCPSAPLAWLRKISDCTPALPDRSQWPVGCARSVTRSPPIVTKSFSSKKSVGPSRWRRPTAALTRYLPYPNLLVELNPLLSDVVDALLAAAPLVPAGDVALDAADGRRNLGPTHT